MLLLLLLLPFVAMQLSPCPAVATPFGLAYRCVFRLLLPQHALQPLQPLMSTLLSLQGSWASPCQVCVHWFMDSFMHTSFHSDYPKYVNLEECEVVQQQCMIVAGANVDLQGQKQYTMAAQT